MRKPPITFMTLHYAWIIALSLLGFATIAPFPNIKAIDAFFFGFSATTDSGLNTSDVKNLNTFQQFMTYLVFSTGNICFVGIIMVAVRLHWFDKKLKTSAPRLLRHKSDLAQLDHGPARPFEASDDNLSAIVKTTLASPVTEKTSSKTDCKTGDVDTVRHDEAEDRRGLGEASKGGGHIHFAPSQQPATDRSGQAMRSTATRMDEDSIEPVRSLHRTFSNKSLARSARHVASSIFVIDDPARPRLQSHTNRSPSLSKTLPQLSSQATVGRNSQFHNLTAEEREILGGIEYRALKLLLRIVIGYLLGLHLIGVVSLVPWIARAPTKYKDYLTEAGQGQVWWGFYSASTMVNNCGLTLTPTSMIPFRDATWPMLIMTFLAFAGNTCYPICLRLLIWTMYKLCKANSSMRQPLRFLLDHPRRCYMLLFPSRPTWILFGILAVLNFIDAMFIVVLDLNNPEVTALAPGPRVLAALFQAASSRHTGTSTFNLANVNPAVQFSLFVMMYIAVYPLAITIRSSNTYEEQSVEIYRNRQDVDESNGMSYVYHHIRNQLSFDLWYIFLGVFIICIAEAKPIMDPENPAFAVFPVLFEVMSAYGNVGLSLGHPSISASLSGKFTTISKLIICAVMLRGRHRMLPYEMDRAIMLPSDRHDEEEVAAARPSQHLHRLPSRMSEKDMEVSAA